MTESKPQLKRSIGLVALALYGIGDILGAGIYGLVGKAAGQMGNAVWVAFLASMIAAGLTGLSYASLGSRFPRAGGVSFIAQKAFRRSWLAYGVGLAALASGLTSMATATRAFSGYFHGLFDAVPAWVAMLGFGLFLGALVFRGIRESIWANSLCTVIEISGLALVILVGVRYIGAVDYLDVTTAVSGPGQLTLPLIFSGAVLTFYSFVGFEDMLNVSEEVVDPHRNLPRGLLIALGVSSIIYMTISVIAVSVVPAGELAHSSEPLVEVVRRAAPWFPTSVFSVIAMFAVANTALLNYIMGSRLIYGMARDGLMPKGLAKLHPTRQTPHVAAAVILLIFLGLALSGDISSLAKATSVLLLICFSLINVALVVLKRRPDEPRGHFEVPIIVPILGVIVCVIMLASAGAQEWTVAGGLLAVIAILYAILRPRSEVIERMEA